MSYNKMSLPDRNTKSDCNPPRFAYNCWQGHRRRHHRNQTVRLQRSKSLQKATLSFLFSPQLKQRFVQAKKRLQIKTEVLPRPSIDRDAAESGNNQAEIRWDLNI